MRITMILPALSEATAPDYRPIKYSLFPPLGLATLAAHCAPDDEIEICDEHVQPLRLDDEPDLVVIQVYITSARRSYEIADHYRARGVRVVLGGLHPTSLPDEAAAHADHLFLGPGDDTWPQFLADLAAGHPQPRYSAPDSRSLAHLPPPRRDLINRSDYLVPNSLVVSRGCPHRCDFCYRDAFFDGGPGFYTQTVDQALAEIDRLPGRHLYFLDDHLLGQPRFARQLFTELTGAGRVWQAAATVRSVLRGDLIEVAAQSGLRSLFVGFETLSPDSLAGVSKRHNVGHDYAEAIRRLHDLGVMVNASFVFGLDGDGPDVFERTVEWAIGQGIETATFHIMTPYPGTALFRRLQAQGRILHTRWDEYDTRHVVFRPLGMSADELEAGYWRAYADFYRWGSIFAGAATKPTLGGRLRHVAYAGGWKKLEPLWDLAIRTKRLPRMLPTLERVLAGQRAAQRSGTSAGGSELLPDSHDLPAPLTPSPAPRTDVLDLSSRTIAGPGIARRHRSFDPM